MFKTGKTYRKKFFKKLYQEWDKLNMRVKMLLSFSISVIVILISVMLTLYYILMHHSTEQVLYSANQSYNQACSFLEQYYNTLLYASELIYYNGDLQRILSSDEFFHETNLGKRYREFLILDQVMSSVERNELICQSLIYIPDNIIYSDNMTHFAPLSSLEIREDFSLFYSPENTYKACFMPPRDVVLPNNPVPVSQVSILRRINSTDGNITELAVAEISMQTQFILDLISNANITRNGVAYLVNQQGQTIGLPEGITDYPGYTSSSDWNITIFQNEECYMKSRELFHSQWMFVAIIPINEINSQARQTRNIFLVSTLLAIFILFWTAKILSDFYTRRISYLNELMHSVQAGELKVPDENLGQDEIGELYQSFHFMADKLSEQMKKQYWYGQMAKNAELRALQSQINPHFLYNTLDLINWEALDHDAPEIADLVQSLALFYRLTLNKGKEITTLQEELRHVFTYVKIENCHFENAIHLSIDVPEELLQFSCLHIIIQPFVENSIMHGMGLSCTRSECNILIRGSLIDNTLVLSVQDDGVGMTDEQIAALLTPADIHQEAHGYGIQNIQERIRLIYGKSYGLSFSKTPGGGTTVKIHIPAWTMEEARKKLKTDDDFSLSD